MLDQCKGEIYVHHVWGHYFFLPGINFFPMGSWHLPANDVKMLVLTIRRVTRLLWTLLLDFEQVSTALTLHTDTAHCSQR